MSDTLSDVLRAVRLTGAVFFTVDATAPWVTETPAAREIAGHIVEGAEHVIDYHIVTAGSCWGGIIGQPAVHLEAGDIIVFPGSEAALSRAFKRWVGVAPALWRQGKRGQNPDRAAASV